MRLHKALAAGMTRQKRLILSRYQGAQYALSESLTDDPLVIDWIITRYDDRKAGESILSRPIASHTTIGTTSCHVCNFTDGTPTAARNTTAALWTAGNYTPQSPINVHGRSGEYLRFYVHNNNSSNSRLLVYGWIDGILVETNAINFPGGAVCGYIDVHFNDLSAITYRYEPTVGNIKLPVLVLRSDAEPLWVLDDDDSEAPLYVLNDSDDEVPLWVLP
jgi:hypothetical protein